MFSAGGTSSRNSDEKRAENRLEPAASFLNISSSAGSIVFQDSPLRTRRRGDGSPRRKRSTLHLFRDVRRRIDEPRLPADIFDPLLRRSLRLFRRDAGDVDACREPGASDQQHPAARGGGRGLGDGSRSDRIPPTAAGRRPNRRAAEAYGASTRCDREADGTRRPSLGTPLEQRPAGPATALKLRFRFVASSILYAPRNMPVRPHREVSIVRSVDFRVRRA